LPRARRRESEKATVLKAAVLKATVLIYRSKVDRSAMAGLFLPIILPVVLGLAILISDAGDALVGWILLLIGVVVGPLMGLLLLVFAWPMTYDPDATRSDGEPILLVRGGWLLRYEIPIAGIREVRPTKSILSSMSWSYDRIEVLYRSPKGIGNSLLISPWDRDAFLDDLVRRAGDLVRAGDRLTRRQDTHVA
jgi:PH (Pleckstrin Homology) domain-containing protein